MGDSNTKKNSTWFHMIFMVVLMCSGWFLPAGAVMTELGMKVLMIFIGVMWGWMFLDLVWPSLLSLLFLTLAGMGTATDIFSKGFGSEIVILTIFFSIFTKWLEDIGLTSTLAQWLLSRKILKGKPYLFLFMMFLVTFICGFFVGIYATIFLMWGICYKMLTSLGYAKREKLTSFILIGVAYVSIMGMTVKPWSPWSLMGVKGLSTATGIAIDYLPYSTFMVVMSLVSTLLFLAFGKWILKIDVSKLKHADFTNMNEKIDFTKRQKLGAFMLLFLLLALYTPSILPDSLLKTMLSNLGSVGVAVFLMVVLCVVRMDGKPLMNFATTARDAVPWNMVCLLTAVGPLGSALMHADTGIVKALMATLKPALAGQSPIFMYILVIVVCCIATQFMNNTILLVVLTPMLCTISQMIDANPVLIAAVLIFGLTAALATPGASSRAGLVFGNTEWIDTRQAYIQAVLSVVAVIITLIAVGIPLGLILF